MPLPYKVIPLKSRPFNPNLVGYGLKWLKLVRELIFIIKWIDMNEEEKIFLLP